MSTLEENPVDQIVFDDSMSWSDSEKGIARVKNSMGTIPSFIRSGKHARFLTHGIFNNDHVQGLVFGSINTFTLMPVIAFSTQELYASQFHDFVLDLELYTEKLRSMENVQIDMYVTEDESYKNYDHEFDSIDVFFQGCKRLINSSFAFVSFSSSRPGEWSDSILINPTKQNLCRDHSGFPSLNDALDNVVKYLQNYEQEKKR